MAKIKVVINGVTLTPIEVEVLAEANRRRMTQAKWVLTRSPRVSSMIVKEETTAFLRSLNVAVMLGAVPEFPGIEFVEGRAVLTGNIHDAVGPLQPR